MISEKWFQKNKLKKFSNDFNLWIKRDIHKIPSDSWTACCVVIESAFKIKLIERRVLRQKNAFKKVISKKWFQKSKTKMNDGYCGSFVSELVNKPLETF